MKPIIDSPGPVLRVRAVMRVREEQGILQSPQPSFSTSFGIGFIRITGSRASREDFAMGS